VVGGLELGEVVAVLEGPRVADDLTWWRVRNQVNREGWAAQGANGAVFLEGR
jgi:hypothetical protein